MGKSIKFPGPAEAPAAPTPLQEALAENAQLKQIIGDQTLLINRLVATLRQVQAQAGQQSGEDKPAS